MVFQVLLLRFHFDLANERMSRQTLKNSSRGEYKYKGSIFHSVAMPVSSIGDIKLEITRIKNNFFDASHICYAYRIDVGNHIDEFSNDGGEPQGSAGQPMLNVLKRNELFNSGIIVIRYFGGTKLGIPGLINAYRSAAENAIKQTQIIELINTKKVFIQFPYELEGKIQSIMHKYNISNVNKNYETQISISIEINEMSFAKFIDEIQELSAGTSKVIISNCT